MKQAPPEPADTHSHPRFASDAAVKAGETYAAAEYDRNNPDFNPVAAIIEARRLVQRHRFHATQADEIGHHASITFSRLAHRLQLHNVTFAASLDRIGAKLQFHTSMVRTRPLSVAF